MMAVDRPISLIQWRDPGDDPAEHGAWDRQIIGLTKTGVIWTDTAKDFAMIGAAGDGAEWDIVAWAELPVMSAATVNEVGMAVRALEEEMRSDRVDDFTAEAIGDVVYDLRKLLEGS